MRQCAICRHAAAKADMLRLVVDEAGQLWPDMLQKAPGRGVYLCMREACLRQLQDKRLRGLRLKPRPALPQAEELLRRIREALAGHLVQLLFRLRAAAAVGRDAVMHRMWNNTPLLLLLAVDAGDALRRQVDDAVAKRRDAGCRTDVVTAPEASLLGQGLGREKVSVAGLECSALSARLEKLCTWYACMKRSR